MKLIDHPKFGPLHRFSDYHVFKTLSVLSDGRRKGRKQLSDKVGIGEGSMRTIVDYLRDQGLIDIKQTGIKITGKGLDLLRKIPIKVEVLDAPEFAVGKHCVAVQVKGAASRINIGIEQRDSAIKAGAEGATTIIMRNGKLLVPPDFDIDEQRPSTASEIRRLFDLEEGDLIILGTAERPQQAEEGALAAAFEIL